MTDIIPMQDFVDRLTEEGSACLLPVLEDMANMAVQMRGLNPTAACIRVKMGSESVEAVRILNSKVAGSDSLFSVMRNHLDKQVPGFTFGLRRSRIKSGTVIVTDKLKTTEGVEVVVAVGTHGKEGDRLRKLVRAAKQGLVAEGLKVIVPAMA